MAITGTYNFRGVEIPGSYVQARSINFVEKQKIKFTAYVWPSEAASADPLAMPIDYVSTQTVFDLDATSNVYAQCYAELLALPQFSGFENA